MSDFSTEDQRLVILRSLAADYNGELGESVAPGDCLDDYGHRVSRDTPFTPTLPGLPSRDWCAKTRYD